MTSIFFPVSTGCGLLSRMYWLPSCSAAVCAGGRERQGRGEHRQQRHQTAHQFLQQVACSYSPSTVNVHWAARDDTSSRLAPIPCCGRAMGLDAAIRT